jgi:hypothetical protein
VRNRSASIRRYYGYSHEEWPLYVSPFEFKAELLCSPVIQVPNDLLEHAKAAAQTALEEMDAD